jgi:hypothetical protein
MTPALAELERTSYINAMCIQGWVEQLPTGHFGKITMQASPP